MKIIHSISEMQKTVQDWRRHGTISETLGFVPTMGALHQGHFTLLQEARSHNKFVVLSIFVNPTQFNNTNDLAKYPKTWEADLQWAEKAGVDCVFTPTFEDIYPDSYRFRVQETELSKILCGAHRPGHFEGMLTIVLKLLNIVRPHHVYFGEKDFQQLSLVKEMVSAFFLDTQIIPVATVRESDGLAMSSRNMRLTQRDRERAPQIFKILSQAPSKEVAMSLLQESQFDVEYLEEYGGRRFVAVRMGQEPNIVRLIDNVKI